MNNNEIRNKIFNSYSENYRKIYKEQKWNYLDNHIFESFEFVVCPLCFQIFSKKSLNQHLENPLTAEDIPPKSLGGKKLLLTCKKCNNESGSTLDHKLVEAVKLDLSILGEVETTPRISILDSNGIKVKLKYDPERKTIQINTGGKNPYANKYLKRIEENWDKSKIEFNFKLGSHNDLVLANIRLAYLYCFYFFGHSYIFSEGGKFIFDILNKSSIDNKLYPIITDNEILKKEGVFKTLINEDFEALLVVLKMKIKKASKFYGIILPGPYETDVNNFKKLLSLKNIKYQFIELEKLDILEHHNYLFEIW